MNDFIGDKQCVTHHHACDCREAAHKKELADKDAEIERLRVDQQAGGMDYEELKEKDITIASLETKVGELREEIALLKYNLEKARGLDE